jgi:hypothetical protein
MKKLFKWKELLPYLIAILCFYLVTLVYFSPILEGKRLEQSDIKNSIGASKEIMDHREKYGEEPYWTNSMFGGMPAYLISTKYTSDFLANAGKVFFGFLPIPAGTFFLYMIGFFILLMALKVDPWLGILGAIAFAFSSYFLIILEVGHNSKAIAIGYMAPVLAGIILLYRGRWLAGTAITALFLSLEIKSTHPQITYYMILMILVILVFQLVDAILGKQLKQFFKASAIFLAVGILAVLTHLTPLLAINEWGKVSIRGKSELSIGQDNKTSGLDRDYATQWSYGKGESWSLLIPNFKGGATKAIGQEPGLLDNVDPQLQKTIAGSNHYWGDQPGTSGPVYAGAIVMFLAVLGMFVLKGRFKWALFTATILSIVFSWGRHIPRFTNFLMDYLPAYNKFRAVSMILVIAEFCIPLLAVLAVNEMIQHPARLKEKINLKIFKANPFILSFLLTGGVALLFWLLPATLNSFEASGETEQVKQSVIQQFQKENAPQEQVNQVLNTFVPQYMNALQEVRIKIFRKDAIRSFFFILLAAVWMYFYIYRKMKPGVLIAGITLLTLIDLWVVDRRYLSNDNFINKQAMEVPFAETAADKAILADPALSCRVFNTTVSTFNDASTSYFHKSIGGYHGAKLRRFQEMLEYHLSANNYRILDMLNMKYIIRGSENGPMAIPNPGAMGNAWFVKQVKWVDNPDQEYIYVGDAAVVEPASSGALITVTGKHITTSDTISVNKPLQLSVSALPDSVFAVRLADFRLQDTIQYTFGSNPADSTPGFMHIGDPGAAGRVLPVHFKARMVYRFDPAKTAIIDKKWKEAIPVKEIIPDSSATISLTGYRANKLEYMTNAATDQLAVFSEIFYEKGWNAYIDGKLTPHGRADWILRAMLVPAGKHKIEFRFEPKIISFGEPIAIGASVVVLLLGLIALWLHYRNLSKKTV